MSLEQIIDDVLNPSPVFGADKEPGEQGSMEWLMERVGFITASRFKDVMDYRKDGKPGADRKKYLWEIAIERLTGKPVSHYDSIAMQHGTEYEPMARQAYEAHTGNFVTEVGFIKLGEFVGGSPDGLIDDDGGLEIKCPFNSANHLQCFLTGMPEEHIGQVQGNIWVTGREWWDFVSFDPRMPKPFDIYVQRVPKDDEYVAKLSEQVSKFSEEVIKLLSDLRGYHETSQRTQAASS